MNNPVSKIAKSFLGSSKSRRTHQENLNQCRNYETSILSFKRTLPPDFTFSDDSPIFIFSAGWRSGSTLLQRIVCSSHDTLIWGEPYARSALIQRLTGLLQPFSDDWPSNEFYIENFSQDSLDKEWIANLYPSTESMMRGLYSMIEQIFIDPAKKLGFERWGLKEVRFGYKEALFLRLLYPNGKFLFLIRDMVDAYKSYYLFSNHMHWYDYWPSKPVFTPYAFGKHHARLRNEFKEASNCTKGMIIRYEDLVNGTYDFNSIGNYCNLHVEPLTISNKVGGSSSEQNAPFKLSVIDKSLLDLGERVGSIR